MGNKVLNFKSSVKLLGVQIDVELKFFNLHIANICSEST